MKKMIAVAVAAIAAGELAAASAVDLEFLRELIRIPSVSADMAEVNRAAEFTMGSGGMMKRQWSPGRTSMGVSTSPTGQRAIMYMQAGCRNNSTIMPVR